MTAWLTGLGLIAAAVTLVFLGGPQAMQAVLREALAPALDGRLGEITPELNELLAFVAFILPGIVATSWMMMTISNGILAQGLLARFGAGWRPSPDLAALGLPMWIPVLLALAAGATLGGTARFIGVNVLIVLAVPFCLAGLAVLHTVARRFPRPAVALVTFYLVAGVLGWPLLLIALLGLLDSPLGLRRRFA